MTDRGCCVEATVLPSLLSPNIVKYVLEAIEINVLMSTFVLAMFILLEMA
jgi:hypothetical protein